MRVLLSIGLLFFALKIQGQTKDKFFEIGASPAISNAILLNVSKPSSYNQGLSQYRDSVSKNRKMLGSVNVFARYTVAKNEDQRFGIGLEYAQYGFKRVVEDPVLGFYKHEDLGVVGGLIEASASFYYITRMRTLEIPLFFETRMGLPKAGSEQWLSLGVAPSWAWDKKLAFFTKGYEEEGSDTRLVNNYRSPGVPVNAVLFAGYKFIIDVNQPVKLVIQPQIRIPVIPTGGDESYMYTQFNLNLGIHFSAKKK